MVSIIAGIITGVLSLIGVIITNTSAQAKVHAELKTSQAVTDAKIEELTREVREHNGFALKIPVIEQQISDLKDKIKELEKSIK